MIKETMVPAMSTTQAQSPPPVKTRRRWWRWGVVALLAAALVSAGVYVYFGFFSDRELREAIAEADRLDPGWYSADIEAARKVVPDAENGANLVMAARALMPPGWQAPLPNDAPTLIDRFAELTPQKRLKDADRHELEVELAKVKAALAKARELADRPRGRYRLVWAPDRIGTLVPHVDDLHRVRPMLILDAALRADRGDGDGAVRTCQAILNAGRSFGDEPAFISQFVRASCAIQAVRTLERTLAAGTATPEVLEKLQRLLADESRHPYFLIGARAARVDYYDSLDAFRTRRVNRASYKMMSSIFGETADEFVDASWAQAAIAAYLRYGTALVEIAKQPTEVQEEKLQVLVPPDLRLPALLEGLGMRRGDSMAKTARSFNRCLAEVRCATAALAAERYRVTEKRWPANLDALVPKYLDAVPNDPFDGRPLRIHRLPDGVVIYSVGPDRVDDGGKLDRKEPGSVGSDIGFQLWNPEKRAALQGP